MKGIISLLLFLFLGTVAVAQKKETTESSKKNNEKKEAENKNSESNNQEAQEVHITPGSSGVKRSIGYKFTAKTTDGDPGNGIFSYDNETVTAIKNLYVDDIDIKGEDQTKWYSTWDKETGASGRGKITVADTSGKIVTVFYFTAVFKDGDGYWKFPVEYVSGILPSDGSVYYYVFDRIAHKDNDNNNNQGDNNPVTEVAAVATVIAAEVVNPVTEVAAVTTVAVAETVKPVTEVAAVIVADPVTPVTEVKIDSVKPVVAVAEVAAVTDVVAAEVINPVTEVAAVTTVAVAETVKPVTEVAAIVVTDPVTPVTEVKVDSVKPVVAVAEVAAVTAVVAAEVVNPVTELAAVVVTEPVKPVTEVKVDSVKPVVTVAEVAAVTTVTAAVVADPIKPVAEVKPEPVKPVSEVKPEPVKPVAEVKPEPVKPAPDVKPAVAAVPVIVAAADKPKPVNPVSQPKTPVRETPAKPVSTPKPVAEAKPVNTTPVAKPVAEPKPVNTTPVAKPVTEPKPVNPVVAAVPVAKADPVKTETKRTDNPPVTQTNRPAQPVLPVYQGNTGTQNTNRRKWYRGIIEAGYALGVGDYGLNNFRFNFINAINIGNYTSIGLGIGYRRYYTDNSTAPYLVSNKKQIPVFLDFRTTFSSKKLTPYLALGIGNSSGYGTSETTKEGFLFTTSGGIWYNVSSRFAVFAGLDYEMKKLEFSDELPFANNYKKNSNSIGLNIGIAF